MKTITPSQCHRLPSANPNDTARPPIKVEKPVYSSSEPMVRHDGYDWIRTGMCVECGAAMYVRLNRAPRNSMDIDKSIPLHHAV